MRPSNLTVDGIVPGPAKTQQNPMWRSDSDVVPTRATCAYVDDEYVNPREHVAVRTAESVASLLTQGRHGAAV